jgi:serine/threonine protein kinase/tetratricopeptide (TPR) repeat protein
MVPGEVVADRFELVRLAQVGGMGAVFRARDRLSGEHVAIKLLRAPGGAHDDRFLREATLLAELRHPAIVRHVAHGRTPQGELYLAMEWLEGEDLARRLSRGALAVEDAIALVRRAADGLAALHARGGVHRDLKPGNLFLDGGKVGNVKILDFGVARAAAALAVTSTGTILGTPGYTAPEQVRGGREVDARADVFALGCVLFECLSGRAPFRGEHVMSVLAKVLLEDPPRLCDVAPHAPPMLELVVSRLLHKDPTRRPGDASVVRDLLDAVARDEQSSHLDRELTPPPVSLGSEEQRFMCLVLCTRGAVARPSQPADETPRPPSVEDGDDAITVPGSEPTLYPDVSPEALAALVRSHGARLECLADGSWVALPDRGTARAPAIDQASQLARVALAMARALPDARVGLASGRGIQAGSTPVGAVIDRALALVRDASGRGVLTDPLTAGLIGGAFELYRDGALLRVLDENVDPAREHRVLGRATPCVGRDRELASLVGMFDEVMTEPCARAVLVKAAAGLGKGRVRAELLAQLRAKGAAFEWLYARGDPLQVGTPYAFAGQLLRRAAGIVDGESVDARRAKLAARFATVADADRARVTAFLGELCRIPAEHAGVASARRDPVVMGDQVRRAWDDWLTAETARHPVVLVLENLHLGDMPTVKLVDSALRNLRDRPLMVLALARPEIDLVFPNLWAERGVTTMPLAELSRRSSTRLVHEILGGDVAPAIVERIVERAGGNTFYLEELCRFVAGSKSADSAMSGELPGTVLAMAEARLDALDGAARRLLRAGSVFGDRFSRGGVLALSGDDDPDRVDRMLRDLVEREVIEPVPAEHAGDSTFAFRHPLVREAAYAMLTDRDREIGHQLAADWLEAAGIADPVLLAEHQERGGSPERAIGGYLAAARAALQGNDLPAVLVRVERGLACGASGESLGELLVLRAEAHRWRADYLAAIEAAQLAMAVMPVGSRGWCGAATAAMACLPNDHRLTELIDRVLDAPALDPIGRLRALARGCVQLYLIGKYPRADQLLATIDAEIARGTIGADPVLAARVHEAHAFAVGARGDQAAALDHLERAAGQHLQAGDLRSACMARNNIGYTFVQLGAYARAVELLDATLGDADRMGQPMVSTILRQNLGLALASSGNAARAAQVQLEAIAAFRAQNDVSMAATSRAYLARLYTRTGELDAAVREAEAAIDALDDTPPVLALALGTLAEAHLARGDLAAALPAARKAHALLDSLGGLDEGELLVRQVLASALDGTGQTDEARGVAAVALWRLDNLVERLPADLRPGYLAICEHVALRGLAERLAITTSASSSSSGSDCG